MSEPFKLLVPSAEQTEATTPLRWCVSREIAEKLSRHRLAFILLSVAYNGREQYRRCIPFEKTMDYIEFHGVGEHNLNAVLLVSDHKEEALRVQRTLTEKSYHGDNYLHLLYEQDPQDERHISRFIPERAETGLVTVLASYTLQVTVPKEFFAKEPPRLLKWWATILWSSPLKDQCDFRRRVLFSFTLQIPIAITLYSFIFVVLSLGLLFKLFWAGIGLFCGVPLRKKKNQYQEGVDIRGVFSFDYDSGEKGNFGWVWDGAVGNSIFLKDREGRRRGFLWGVFFPPIGLSTLLILWSVNWFWGTHSIFHALRIAALTLVALFASTLFFAGILRVMGWLGKRLFTGPVDRFLEFREGRRLRREEEHEQQKEERTLRLLAERRATTLQLSCDSPLPLEFDVRVLPKRRQTVALRLSQFKAKVCKPFAR